MAVIILSAGLSFAAAIFVLLAAAGKLRGRGFAADAQAADRALYRSQMAEIGRLERNGLLDNAGAAEARRELARRILAAEKQAESAVSATAGAERRRGFLLLMSAAILAIPLFSGAVYYYQGRPFAPDTSFADFMARSPQDMSPAEQITRLEALTARNPQNGGQADALAALYLQAGRFQDAANAYNRAIALNGENAPRLLGLALALTGYNGGLVGTDAETAFRAALKYDPHNLEAQLFLARSLVQSGRAPQAEALLQGFLAQTNADAPQRPALEAAIAVLRQGPAAAKTAEEPPLTAEQRQFISANLSRLEAKLQAAPQDLQGWTMLLNAYLLLGDKGRARQALARAAKVLPQPQADSLRAAAAKRGLTE